MHSRPSALAAIALLLASGAAAEYRPTIDEIINRANKVAYYEGRDYRARVSMTITDGQGRSRERRLTLLRRDSPDSDAIENGAYRGEQKLYVYFTRPADLNKMVFMVWKKLADDDDRWLYLPALDLVKRIAASDKRTSFVGSDFFYEDVSGRDIDEDSHELLEVTDNYYVLKSIPRDPASVEFAHYMTYVHKASFIPVQIEYFNARGEKYRVAKALEVATIDGHPTVLRASMEQLQIGSTTVVEYGDVEYDLGLPEEIFTERYLRNPPRERLR